MQKKALIVDLDGTLYYQKPVQMCMAAEILLYYLLHFWRIKELFLILAYRKKHNNEQIFDLLSFAKAQKADVQFIEQLIQKWLFYKPLKWIKIFADKNLIKILNIIKQKIPVVIYSDYKTELKLKVLSFQPTFNFFYDGKDILFLKPNPQGLSYIAQKLSLCAKDILVIGDRQDKDGLAALAFGAEYLILPQNPIIRRKILKKAVRALV